MINQEDEEIPMQSSATFLQFFREANGVQQPQRSGRTRAASAEFKVIYRRWSGTLGNEPMMATTA